jgi:hypothetical protein
VPYYRRQWSESRGDRYDGWGTATYYFWVQDGVVEQQVEIYQSGVILAYDRYHDEDEFGFRTYVTLDHTEWSPYEIDIETYQRETDGKPMNR